MTVGADRKKLYALGILLLGAGYSIYTNVLSPDEPPGAKQQAKSSPSVAPSMVPGLPQPPVTGQKQKEERLAQRKDFAGKQSVGEFRASMKYTRPEDRPDPMTVDPTLRLDLMARLQKVMLEGGHRSLFDFGTAPPPKPTTPDPKIAVGPKGIGPKGAEVAKAAETAKPAEAPKPPPPPIPLKFYGFVTPKTGGGAKRAFFLEGEDIHVAAEGDLIKRRYKIVRVGVNSAVVEDTQYNNQQTLPLEEPPVTG